MQENRLESMCTPVLRDPHAARAAEMVIGTRTGAAAAVTHIRIALVVPVFAPHLIAVGSRWRRRGVRESERDCMCMHRTESWVVEENAHERDSAMQVSRARRTQVNEPKDKQIDHGRAWNAATAAVPHQHTHTKSGNPLNPLRYGDGRACVCVHVMRGGLWPRDRSQQKRERYRLFGARARAAERTRRTWQQRGAAARFRARVCVCVCVGKKAKAESWRPGSGWGGRNAVLTGSEGG